jgi:periplasmic divalent cation tolerance protein
MPQQSGHFHQGDRRLYFMSSEDFTRRAADDDHGDAAAFLEVSTATETKAAAEELARLSVESRLAAGAQIIGPVASAFWHLGEFGTGEEWRLVLRTHEARFAELRDLILRNHPWKKPEVIATRMAGSSKDYLDWIRRAVLDGKAAD